MKVFVQGNPAPVSLGQGEFRARGGQGAIYVRGGTAFKIFGTFVEKPPNSGNLEFVLRPEWALPVGKIQELAAITIPEAVKPELPILDAQGKTLGHTMRAIDAKYVLTATLPRVFRDREGLTPDDSLRISQTIQRVIKDGHRQGFRLVDIQPNNFLLSEDFETVHAIDVDSWATPHYPALALIPSARDWVLCPTDPPAISEETDWFSLAMLIFEIFVGIHPFKGKHPRFPKLAIRERMEARVSVLNPEVKVAADSILPLSVIPPAYRKWFEELFEKGRRLPPPEGPVFAITINQASLSSTIVVGTVRLFELRSADGELLTILPGGVDVSTGGIYVQTKRIAAYLPRTHYAVTPRGLRPIACALGAHVPATGMRKVELQDVQAGSVVPCPLEAHDLVGHHGTVVMRVAGQLLKLSWLEAANGAIRVATDVIAQVSEHTTQLFPGVAIQAVLGSVFASLWPMAGGVYPVRLRELEGKRLLDARLESSVLQVLTNQNGLAERWVFRFSRDFKSYDAEALPCSNGAAELNFAVLDTGICIEVGEDGDMRLYAARPGSRDCRAIKDPGTVGRLFADGTRLLGGAGGKISQLKLENRP